MERKCQGKQQHSKPTLFSPFVASLFFAITRHSLFFFLFPASPLSAHPPIRVRASQKRQNPQNNTHIPVANSVLSLV
jgi:hypothetical protein